MGKLAKNLQPDGDQVSLQVVADPSVWVLEDSLTIRALSIDLAIVEPQITVSGNQLIASEGQRYQWYRDGELLPDTSQILIAQESGIYQVEIINELGCSYLSSELALQVITSIDARLKDGVSLYPNPVSFSLQIHSQLNEPVDCLLLSPLGQRLLETKLIPQQGDVKFPMDHFAPGVYVLQLSSPKGRYYHKVVKK